MLQYFFIVINRYHHEVRGLELVRSSHACKVWRMEDTR